MNEHVLQPYQLTFGFAGSSSGRRLRRQDPEADDGQHRLRSGRKQAQEASQVGIGVADQYGALWKEVSL